MLDVNLWSRQIIRILQSMNNHEHSKLIVIKMHRSFNYANLIFQPEQNIRHQVQSLLREN